MSVSARRYRRWNSRRYPAHAYDGDAVYHVTLRLAREANHFGVVTDKGVLLNASGRIAEEELLQSERIRSELHIDTYVIMPDHVHVLLRIERSLDFKIPNARRDIPGSSYLRRKDLLAAIDPRIHRSLGPRPRSLGAFVAGFKSVVTRRIRERTGQPDVIVWKRNYHDRIIRTARVMRIVRAYINANPAREWKRLTSGTPGR